MSAITHLRCLNHGNREAVARCPQCGRNFCRECIAEHDGRVICARCLAALVRQPAKNRVRVAAVLEAAWCLLSFLFLWAACYYLGRALLMLPSAFHDTFFQ
jgi:uncharacterized paraquat-inducible protein A